ncbi:MAG: hypothetical protein IJU19_00845 [Bacteroidales bacterium]|nr:hypothetical protein [Bacteroidales bacterium]
MKLKVLGSSSAGNGYILQGERQTLLLEAGVPIAAVRKHVDDFRTIVGCLVSHSHGDHAKYIADYAKAGIHIYADEDVCLSCKGVHVNSLTILEDGDQFRVGGFRVMACSANHDVPCLGYFILHDEMGSLAFITDSHDYQYSMTDLQHLMIEVNWSEELLRQAVDEKRTPWFVAKRVRETHMGLHNAINYIQEEVSLDALREIVMLHLSYENSDPRVFTEEITKAFQKPTFVAAEGLEIELKR